jgi:hypothetical protein
LRAEINRRPYRQAGGQAYTIAETGGDKPRHYTKNQVEGMYRTANRRTAAYDELRPSGISNIESSSGGQVSNVEGRNKQKSEP